MSRRTSVLESLNLSLIDDAQGGAGKIREGFFARLMILPHHEIDILTPLPPEDLRRLALLIAVRMLLLILVPQQGQGDTFFFNSW